MLELIGKSKEQRRRHRIAHDNGIYDSLEFEQMACVERLQMIQP